MMDKKNRIRLDEAKRTFRIIFDSPLGTLGLIIILIFVLITIFANVIAPHNPYEIDIFNKLQPPSKNHFFGTDQAGRDIFSRVLYGSRYSLFAGLIVVVIGVTVGTSVGLTSGYPGNKRGELLMRVTDIFFAFPTLVLAIALAATMGPSFVNSMIAISLVYWPKYARLVYGQSLSIKENDFIKFAETLREKKRKIRLKHILPNCISVLIVQATLDFGEAILFFASLSFIGLGAQPPAPDWGAMVSISRGYMMVSWWMAVFPGLAIFFVVMGFNLLGDSLRDAFDPQLRRLKAYKPLRFSLVKRIFKKN